MFKITYRNSLKDLIWFNFHSYKYFPLNLILILPGVFIIFINLIIRKELSWSMIILDIIGTYLILIPIVSLLLVVLIFLIYKSGKEKSVICEHELSFSDDSFIEATEYNENKYKWNSVVKFRETKKYLLIYVSGISAHIIPKSFLSNEETNKIVEFVSNKIY